MAKSSLNGQTYLMFKFLNVDARDIGLTVPQAKKLNERSKNGEREAVRAELLALGAVDKGPLPDLARPSVPQGLFLRRELGVDIREANGSLTRTSVSGFIGMVKDGKGDKVRESLLALGAVDTRS